VVLLLHECEARGSQLWTSQNIKCKDKEKAMQKQGKGDVLIKKELENIQCYRFVYKETKFSAFILIYFSVLLHPCI
jgi:hypothetical protein